MQNENVITDASVNSNALNTKNEVCISIRDIAKRYSKFSNVNYALENIKLDIYEGEFVAITGSSGSGKSTLLQIIGCLDRPTRGSVVVYGKEITRMHDKNLSRLRGSTMGFVFQSFYLQPFLNIVDNIAIPAMFTTLKNKEIYSRALSLLEKVGLSDKAKSMPHELSGGQMQRVAIARALINNPRIILADEPTGNLDSTNSKLIIDLFMSICRDLKTTIIIVTHDNEIADRTDRVIHLKDGNVV